MRPIIDSLMEVERRARQASTVAEETHATYLSQLPELADVFLERAAFCLAVARVAKALRESCSDKR